jgi:uncharacterized nucleotidyltransferase DUF6036
MRRVADAALIGSFMRALGEAAGAAARVYFAGGATAVLLGWRSATLDIDVRWRPEHGELFDALPRIKERLGVNVELAWPFDFIPELPGWERRCLFIETRNKLDFFHCDLYSQALAKIERLHELDRADVGAMLERGLIDADELRAHFEAITPQLKRFPAIDPPAFRRNLEEVLAGGGASTSGS